MNEDRWLDEEAGPLVRSYALTGGRTSTSENFDLLTYVVSRPYNVAKADLYLQPEHHSILKRAQQPVSVAELTSHLGLSLNVVRVLLGDLNEMSAIVPHSPPRRTGDLPSTDTLEALLAGLRSYPVSA
ncbi:DUF742 domain-containing protein [Catelliglobosispora koreensis]|uniref:DUF742 domain-containing protein n=1 Tax=Catelliglobosispora koreensis TaxID=129052 RepID=UPI000363B380|nr:DUF742 domain-containing protein [Catelliglobosispora koreensis]